MAHLTPLSTPTRLQDVVRPALRRTACDLEILIPAFNEERRLPATLRAVLDVLCSMPEFHCRIVIVDNGSVDRTAEIADRLCPSGQGPEVVVTGCSVGGKGAAVIRGVLSSNARIVGFLDADLAVPAETIVDAVRTLLNGEDDVVIGSRRCFGARYEVEQPPVRRLGSLAFRKMIGQLVPGIQDSQCGFKFFSGAAAQEIFAQIHTTGWTFDVEVLMRALKLGYAVREIPVVWSDGADSTLRLGSHGLGIARDIARLHLINQGRFPKASGE